MLLEQRKNTRYQAHAKARVVGFDCGECEVKDLSIIGCCVTSAKQVDVKPGAQYEIDIIPEKAASIGKFEILAETKRVNSMENSTELGFSILKSPKGKHFQRYVDYLAWRSGMGAS